MSSEAPFGMERCVGSWIIEGELGRGSFAVVWRARHATTGAPAAVKEINTDKLNKKLQESLASEVAVLSQTKHRNIVGLLDLLKVRRWRGGAVRSIASAQGGAHRAPLMYPPLPQSAQHALATTAANW
jgi:serine/threonine protein kinase